MSHSKLEEETPLLDPHLLLFLTPAGGGLGARTEEVTGIALPDSLCVPAQDTARPLTTMASLTAAENQLAYPSSQS